MSSKPRSDIRKKPASRLSRVAVPVRDEVRLGRRNWILFGAALGLIALGYVMLSQGSITFAPLFLVAGYCVILPWAILAQDPAAAGGESRKEPEPRKGVDPR